MANPEHLEILKQGVEVWNRWKEDGSYPASDLSGADLTRINLYAADLSITNLSGADLSWKHLYRVNFSEANLYKTNFTNATFAGTVFGDVDLSEVKGLDKTKHQMRSYIDTNTLARSKGKIPEDFLRRCGLSDMQIEMAKLHNPNLSEDQIVDITYKLHELLAGGAIKYNSCFISYSHQDASFADRLHNDLQDNGVRCWFAPEDLKIGDKIRPTIDQSIRIHDKLLLILSGNTLNSFWVVSEVEKAFEEERKRNQTVLFPVRLDEAVMDTDQAWAAQIRRTRHIGDFSRWKDHDAYQVAFGWLLRNLKAEG